MGTWYNVELNKDKAEKFNKYLKENIVVFEPSEAYNLVHFECFMNEEELDKANKYLAKLK